MEEFKYAQEGLDKLFEKIGVDRRAGQAQQPNGSGNRSERRQREKNERRAKSKNKQTV